jgi:amino acid adenylation domain-containing protein
VNVPVRARPGASPDELRAQLVEQLNQAAEEDSGWPLSFSQQRLWFLDQLEPNTPLYNIPSVARLTGPLQVPALELALNAILERHESLRTRFITQGGQPAQVIDEQARLKLQVEDLGGIADAEREAAMCRRVEEEVRRPFNLSTDRLIRVTLFRLQPQEHVLVVNMHHIVSDEWSFGVFYRELAAFYAGFVKGQPVHLPELPIQYADFADWQQEWLQSKAYEKQLNFWKSALSGAPTALELPADRLRPSAPTFKGAGRWRRLDPELTAQLHKLAKQEKATLFMLLLAAFKVFLYRYTQQEDIIVGSPVSGRSKLETESLIGFFVNTLPLRTQLSAEMTFPELLAQVRDSTLAAISNQDLPFEKLVEALHPERSPSQTPFVNVMFIFQGGQGRPPELPGLTLQFLGSGTGTAKFDLTLGVQDSPQGLVLGTEYSTDLFEDATIARWLEHLENLLRGIVANPAQRLWELPLLSPAERQQMLFEWNATHTDYPRSRCVHELFETQAAQTPKAVAVVCGNAHLTYRELNRRANQLAHHLRLCGVKPRMPVGLCLERSLEMVVGMLGILKAGAAYAPLDPALPKERLVSMLQDLQVSLLLTQSSLAHALPKLAPSGTGPAPRCLCLDTDWKAMARESVENLVCENDAEDLAYITFTSGSTGRPKGVCLPHRGIVRLVKNTHWLDFSPGEVFFQTAPVSFDPSLFEIWGALLNGARVVLPPPHLPSLSELAEVMQKQSVTTAWFTAGLFHQLVEDMPEVLKPLHQLVTGGDVVSPAHVKKALEFLPQGRLLNGYGPTENGTFSTSYVVPRNFGAEHSVPIGRPLSNSQAYILDKHLQPVPIGVPGELYVGGDGLAISYLNRTELTAERFIAHPFQPGARLYRTGDLARYLPDGNIEFLGRIDLQLKVRGFRIEPGEIEMRLLQHPAIRECAVTAHTNSAGHKQLVAYLVLWPHCSAAEAAAAATTHPEPPRPEELLDFLRPHLPDYMLPSCFVTLRELPLSPNGKVDRRALPPPEAQRQDRRQAHMEPRDDLERQLQQLWQTVLDVKPIGIHDQFFALGGHSLLAVRLVAEVERTFGRKLRVASVFQNPTIEQLAALLRTGQNRRPDSAIVEIQPRGSRPPLLLVHGAGGGMFWGYANLARYLGPEQPVFAFKSRGLDGLEEFATIESMAEAYLTELRAFQPRGPYYLGGYCFGGVVAFEMGRRLQAMGERVALLALINSGAPNSSYAQFRWTPTTTLRFTLNLTRRVAHFATGPSDKLLGYARWKSAIVLNRLRGRLQRAAADRMRNNVDDWLDLTQFSADQRQVWHTHIHALEQYHPQPYPGNVTLFRSPVHGLYCSFDARCGWGDYAHGGVTLRLIPGAHETIMEEPGVQRLAADLQQFLTQAQLLHRQL